VLAGHNGSGKSTLWYRRLVADLQIPLINADRLTLSILPVPDRTNQLPAWAQRFRDSDERWQRLSQEAVEAFVSLVTEKQMPFAVETVFSHWRARGDGTYESKADLIETLQHFGYFVVLLFVGLSAVELSVLRVLTRKAQGGHDVPVDKLYERYPRTQRAIGHAAPLADMTIMFDNSRSMRKAFELVRVQRGAKVLFDCRDPAYRINPGLKGIASLWLDEVVGTFRPTTGKPKG
jgi:predicted ABC-type ATPase